MSSTGVEVNVEDIRELKIFGDEINKTGIYECDITTNDGYKYPALGIFDKNECIKQMLNINKLPSIFNIHCMLLYMDDILQEVIVDAVRNINVELLFAIFTNSFLKCKSYKHNLLHIAIEVINDKLSYNLDYVVTKDEYNMIQYIVCMFPNITESGYYNSLYNKYAMNLILRTPYNKNNSVSRLRDSICGKYYWSPLVHGLINPELKFKVGILTKYFGRHLLNMDVIEKILSKSIIISILPTKTYTIGDILDMSGLSNVSIEDRMKIEFYANSNYEPHGKASVLISHTYVIFANTYYENDAMNIKQWIMDNIDKLDEIDFSNDESVYSDDSDWIDFSNDESVYSGSDDSN